MMTEQRVPQDVETELCVLGAIMLEPKSAFPLAAEVLLAHEFYLDGHAIIFATMQNLHGRGIPPDSVVVIDQLRDGNLLEQVGGAGVIMGMLNSVPTAANVEHHARLVSDKAKLRGMITQCTQIIQKCSQGGCAPSDAVAEMERAALEASQGIRGNSTIRLIGQDLGEVQVDLLRRAEIVEAARAAGKQPPGLWRGVATDLVDLDNKLYGLRAGELTIIAGRPSMGKTALALNIAYNVAVRQGVSVGMISLEMTGTALAERLACLGSWSGRSASVSSDDLNKAEMGDAQWASLQRSFEAGCKAPLHIEDTHSVGLSDIRSISRRMRTKHKIEILLIDYLGLITGSRYKESRVNEVGEVSRGLKALARELGVPAVVMCQLSRKSEGRSDKQPVLSDLRDSGDIEQDADVVILLHREDYYNKNQRPAHEAQPLELIVAKNRNGPTGLVDVGMVLDCGKIYSLARRVP